MFDLLRGTATPLGSIGQWNSFGTLPSHWGAVGPGIQAGDKWCSTASSPWAERRFAEGVLLPIAAGHCGDAHNDFHGLVPRPSAAAYQRSSTAHCHGAVGERGGGGSMPVARGKCGSARKSSTARFPRFMRQCTPGVLPRGSPRNCGSAQK